MIRYTEKAHLIAYTYDATSEYFEPDTVLFTPHKEDISNILKYCNKNKIIILPHGQVRVLQMKR